MFNPHTLLRFPIYSGWTQYTPVIPKFYWDVYSMEQRLKQLCMNFDKVEHYLDYVADLMNQWNIDFTKEIEDELREMWELINNGMEGAAQEWLEKNLEWLFTEVAKQVYFGLTLNGYFVAYIPDGWDDIIFDTGMVYGEDTYGRLILRWDVDNSGYAVNQRPENWR